MTAIMCEHKRDPERRRDPYTAAEFYLFVDRDDGRPDSRATSAYQALITKDRLPAWALFCYDAFRNDNPTPFSGDPAMIGDGFILLAPIQVDEGFTGTMLALQDVAGKVIEVTWDDERYRLHVPEFTASVIARAGETIRALP